MPHLPLGTFVNYTSDGNNRYQGEIIDIQRVSSTRSYRYKIHLVEVKANGYRSNQTLKCSIDRITPIRRAPPCPRKSYVLTGIHEKPANTPSRRFITVRLKMDVGFAAEDIKVPVFGSEEKVPERKEEVPHTQKRMRTHRDVQYSTDPLRSPLDVGVVVELKDGTRGYVVRMGAVVLQEQVCRNGVIVSGPLEARSTEDFIPNEWDKGDLYLHGEKEWVCVGKYAVQCKFKPKGSHHEYTRAVLPSDLRLIGLRT